MRFISFIYLLSLTVAAFGAERVPEAIGDWPQFLGPHRNGISSETNLLDAWPKDGPKEVWRSPGGVGMSGLVISKGRVFTLVQRDGQQWLLSLNSQTGKRNWETAIAPEYKNQMGDGPRATPAIAGEHVFAFTGDGTLAAIRLEDGKIIWSQQVVEQLKGKPADYGMACSPLVVGEHVIITVGAPEATVAAFNTATGKLLWKTGDDPAGYSSPALLNVGGLDQIVAFTGNSIIGIEPPSGRLLWRYPYVTDYSCNIATPLGIENSIFISSGENHGSTLLSVQAEGDAFQVTPVWESQGLKSVMRNEWQTSILLDGYLYGFDNVGSAGPVTHLACINATTGDRVWQQPRFGKGNLIAADGKLIVSTMKGEIVLIRASPEGFQEIGRSVVLGSTRQAPALASGMVYLRDDFEIVCLDLRRSAAKQ